MISNYALVIDTNTFGRITANKNEAIFDNLFQSLSKAIDPENKISGYMNVITPFLLFEYLGATAPQFSVTFPNRAELLADTKNEIYKQALKVYESNPSLTASQLRFRNSENLKRVSAKANRLYQDVVEHAMKQESFAAHIHRSLALDFLYRCRFDKQPYEIPDKEIAQLHYQTFLDIYAFHREKQNICQTRGIINLAVDLKRQVSKNGKLDKNSKTILKATEGIKPFRDLVDLELVQIACLGAFVEDKKYPVVILTEDTKAEFKKRATLFKATFNYFKNLEATKLHLSKNAESLEEVDERPGIVFFINHENGGILDRLNISVI